MKTVPSMNLVLLDIILSKKLGLSAGGMPYMLIQVKGRLPPVLYRKLMLNHPSTKGFSGMLEIKMSLVNLFLCQHFMTILSFSKGN